jgi:S-adenosylmethionine decarboxylase
LKLRVLGAPQLSEHEHEGVATIAGVVLLAESHASCHCFPSDGAAHIDVFSCRPFELEVARKFILRHFGAAELRDSVLDRGGSQSRHKGPVAELKRAR